MRSLIIFIAISFLFVSCTDPFDIGNELKQEAGQPVINGWISNFPNDYRIYISRTTSLTDEAIIEPVSDAKVFVKNASDEEFEALYDSREKNYSLPNLFAGKEGETYWVEVTFSDGQVFQSEPQLLQIAPPIESLNFGKNLGFNDGLNAELKEVIVNINDPSDKRNYYLWVTENLSHSPISADTRIYNIENDQAFNGQSKSVFVSQATGQAPVLVRQLSLSRAGYRYFDFINQLNESQNFDSNEDGKVNPISNGLFAKPPVSLEGNIFEKGNQSNYGAGYFGVYGQVSMALAQDNASFPLDLVSVFENVCKIKLANGIVTAEPGFEDCVTFPQQQGTEEDGWKAYVFQNDLDQYFHDIYFSGFLRKVTLRSSSLKVRFEARSRRINSGQGEAFVENLYLLVENGFSGQVDLEIEATNFLETKTVRYTLTIE